MTLVSRTGIINTYTPAFSASGGTTTDSGGYRYHTFNSSGSFIVAGLTKSMDVLVVGSGEWVAGVAIGGGAGRVTTSTQSFAPGTYTVTVGAGGTSSSIRSNGAGETTYNIGDTGPAGGVIFITPSTAGNNTGKYFEAAPVGSIASRSWSSTTYNTYFATSTSDLTLHAVSVDIGAGERNTESIYYQRYFTLGTANADSSGLYNAAAYCWNFTYGGYSDWFLPSREEALKLPASHRTNSRWTSTEFTNDTAVYVDLSGWYFFNKSYGLMGACPVRSFTTSSVSPVFALGGYRSISNYRSAYFQGNYAYTIYDGPGGSGAGGAGIYTSAPGAGGTGITWNNFVTVGGGGGGGAFTTNDVNESGGAGGSGGGGAGGSATTSPSVTNGVNGTANTGGGGGGGARIYIDKSTTLESSGGTGGSGVVIMRYLL